MLNFFAEYREAIDKLTEDRRLGLRKYEVSEEEWDTVEELSKVLKVSRMFDSSPCTHGITVT